jgi:hypothetical protein
MFVGKLSLAHVANLHLFHPVLFDYVLPERRLPRERHLAPRALEPFFLRVQRLVLAKTGRTGKEVGAAKGRLSRQWSWF